MVTRTFASLQRAWRFAEPLVERPCRVLFAGPHFQAAYPLTQQVLETRGHCSNDNKKYIELVHAPTPDDVARLAPTAHVAIPFMERFPKSFFETMCSTNLRLVVQFGVGLEGVDVETATKLGVAVSNIPADGTGNAQATSEHALFLAISLLRHVEDLKRRFSKRELGGLPSPRTLYQKRVTVVGYGSVGKVLCKYLVTMGANVQVVRKSSWSKEEESVFVDHPNYCNKAESLQDAFATTDVLILACLMTPETYHLINEETLALLPRGALIVNVGRGHLVEHGAILSALQSGHVGGFASDVGVGHPTKPSEPWDPDDELSRCPNTLFTPHVGGYTDYSYSIMSNKIVDAIECAIDGKPPPVWVNSDLSS
jgi:lactate dehydrogenase-like 2-hydroxyacid dehydrogenase